MALTELGKLRTFGQVNDLDAVCREQLVESDYEQFAEAKDARLKALQNMADAAAAEAKRKKK